MTVALARWLTPLPYRLARMGYQPNTGGYRFQCRPLAGGGHHPCLDASFGPQANSGHAPPGSSAEWLLERYGLYAAGPNGTLLRTVVQHPRWRINDVCLRLSTNTIGDAFNLDLCRSPECVHYSLGTDARVWPFADA